MFMNRQLQLMNSLLPLRACLEQSTATQFAYAIFKTASRHSDIERSGCLGTCRIRVDCWIPYKRYPKVREFLTWPLGSIRLGSSLRAILFLPVPVQQFTQLFTQSDEHFPVVFDLDAPAKGVHTLALGKGNHANLQHRLRVQILRAITQEESCTTNFGLGLKSLQSESEKSAILGAG